MKNYYEILGIDKNSSKDEIKKAYRKLLRKYPPEKEAEKYKEIREAYDTLRDEKSKKSYDAHLLHGEVIKKLERSADMHIEAKQYFSAEIELKKILLLSEEDTVIREKLANVFLEQEDFRNAQREYEKLSKEYPDNTNYLLCLGLIYEKQEKKFEAERYYKKAYESDYTNSTAISALVNLYIHKNEVDKAISFLEAEVYRDNSLDFDDFFALTKLLECYVVKNDTYNLDKIIDKIKFIAPPDEDSRDYMSWKLGKLGYILYEAQIYKMAEKIAKVAMELTPGNKTFETLFNISKLYVSLEKFMKDQFISKELKIPIVNYMLGEKLTEQQRINMEVNLKHYLSNIRNYEIPRLESQIRRIKSEYPELYNETSRIYDALLDACIKTKRNEGCYIATAVYGDYDAAEVLTLRRFRDEVLKKSTLGRLFIKIYYKYSPSLAAKLKSTSVITKIIKKVLDKFVKYLESK